MNLDLSSLHISEHPPTCISALPPELLQEIFHLTNLSKHDLAQCCLLSRHFLDIARTSLYRDLFFHVDSPNWPDLSVAAMDEKSFQLLETLRSTPEVGNLVTGLDIQCYISDELLVQIGTHRTLFEELLELLPEVNRLFIQDDSSDLGEVLEIIHLHGHRWTELEIIGLWEIDLGQENAFPNMQLLDCWKIVSSDSQGRIWLPPSLKSLVYRIGGSSYPNVSTHPLRSLWTLSRSTDETPELARLPQLETLVLRYTSSPDSDISRTVDTINNLQQLASLELECLDKDEPEDSSPLLSRLALSPRRLVFRYCTPFKVLATLLDTDRLKSLEILVLPKEPLELDHFNERCALLTRACERRKIRIEYVPSPSPDLFELS